MSHNSRPWTRFLIAPLAALALASCAEGPAAPESARVADAAALDAGGAPLTPGAVYTLSNDAAANAVIAFRRATDGSLTPLGTFETGGRGIGGTVDPLTSQFALILGAQHEALFAVNAGSDEISSFRVNDDGSLAFAGKVSSGGDLPVSLAVHGNLLYALNAGDNTLQGFRITGDARLVALPAAATPLATGAEGAAAVRFTPDGRFLIVSERVSNRLEVFAVRPGGALGEPAVSPASGGASFGFDITARNQPIVSETQGSLTSYALGANGGLTPITASISTDGTAACWVIISADGRFAYTTNAGSNSVAGFTVDAAGRLTAITPGTATGESGTGASPIDLDQVGSKWLYTLEAGTGTIGTFTIGADGRLTARPDTPAGPPAGGLQGLAAF